MARKKASSGTHWFRNTLCVLIACGIVGTIISGIMFLTNPEHTYASASIGFSFDGAADGVAPNGNRFDIRDMASDEVLNRALESAGMTGRYSAEEIRNQLEIQGVYPENIISQMMNYESLLDFDANRSLAVSVYYPTQYDIRLNNDFDKKISKTDLKLLLDSILASYRQYFTETYSIAPQMAAIGYELEEYDYPQQLTILSRLMSESATYAEELYEKEPTLTVSGIGFSDIAVRLNALIANDVSRLNANVTINALTKRINRLILQYKYEIHNLENEKLYRGEQLENMKSLLSQYEEQKSEVLYLATADSVTKIDGNSSETYDQLMAARKSVENQIVTINTDMEDYQLMLDDLTGAEKEAQSATDAAASDLEEGSMQDVAVDTDNEAVAVTETETDASDTEAAVTVSQEEIDTANAAKKPLQEKLEAEIATLLSNRESIMKDFNVLIKAYNDQEINDLTVSVSDQDYKSPSLLSGAFIKQTLKVAGPFCAVGFIVCLVLLIISRRKEEKAAEKQLSAVSDQ